MKKPFEKQKFIRRYACRVRYYVTLPIKGFNLSDIHSLNQMESFVVFSFEWNGITQKHQPYLNKSIEMMTNKFQ